MSSFQEAVLLKRLSIRRAKFVSNLEEDDGIKKVALEILGNLDDKGVPGVSHRIDKSGNYGLIEYHYNIHSTPKTAMVLGPTKLARIVRDLSSRIVESYVYDGYSDKVIAFCYNDPASWDDRFGGENWRVREYGGLA